ncbi:hypothetical protein E3A20_26330 [Planctomyces bekefii]|uniref:Uncharacterized protein n=1 Tax=Planctomyces bekefii TaxID=1653850 RepID=A0A5C6M0X2_9PLAN|nr:hypothetical protein E3A20_26330 [Planctomyces bekefii]
MLDDGEVFTHEGFAGFRVQCEPAEVGEGSALGRAGADGDECEVEARVNDGWRVRAEGECGGRQFSPRDRSFEIELQKAVGGDLG